jgi:hypothetical protein
MSKVLEYYLTNVNDEVKNNGMLWYRNAFNHCDNIATKYSVSIELVASVVAALSPRNKWMRNLIDAENVVSYVFNGTPLQKVSTYGMMLKKALQLCNEGLSFDDRVRILNGRKIQSFFTNIMLRNERVTVDTWVDLAFKGKYIPTKKRKALTLSRYKQIEQAIIKLSKKYAIEPYEAQAIIWLNFQRIEYGK